MKRRDFTISACVLGIGVSTAPLALASNNQIPTSVLPVMSKFIDDLHESFPDHPDKSLMISDLTSIRRVISTELRSGQQAFYYLSNSGDRILLTHKGDKQQVVINPHIEENPNSIV